VREFLEGLDPGVRDEVEGVCMAVAGPIEDGVCHLPNLGWTLDAHRFGTEIGFAAATLINDFEAVGHGVLFLEADGYASLQEGRGRERAPIAVLGPGTGLGQGFLLWEQSGYRVHASEGGHGDFAPRTDLEWGLAEHLRAHFGHASWERVLSGPGLVEIYRYLAAFGFAPEAKPVVDELTSGVPPEVISRHGLQRTDRLSEQALEIFVSALGAQAGNLALTVEATGGVWIAGGIAPRLLTKLQEGSFMAAFRNKGRLSDLLEGVPVRVILDGRVGLKGAARVAAGRRT
jgi:glucokinase